MTSSLMRDSAHAEPAQQNAGSKPEALSHDVLARLASAAIPSPEHDLGAPEREFADTAPIGAEPTAPAVLDSGDSLPSTEADHPKAGLGNQQSAAVTVADFAYHQNHQEVPMKAADFNHADFSHAGDFDAVMQKQSLNVTANVGNNVHPPAPALPDVGSTNPVPAVSTTVDHLAAAAPEPQDLPAVGQVAGALPQPHGLPGVGEVAGALPQPHDLPGVGEVAGALPQPHGLPGVEGL